MNRSRLLTRYYVKGQGGTAALFGMKSVKSVAGRIGMGFLTLYLALVFGFFVYSSCLSRMLTDGMKFLLWVSFYTFNFPFIFITPLAIGLFQQGRDLDMMLSWPLTRKEIFSSRFRVLMIYLLPLSLVVYVPVMILSAQLFGFSPLWLISYTFMHLASVVFVGMLQSVIASTLPKQVIQVVTTGLSLLMMFLLLRAGMDGIDMVFEGKMPVFSMPSPEPLKPFISGLIALAAASCLLPVALRYFGSKVRDITFGRKDRRAVQRTGTPVKALMKSELMQIMGDGALMNEFVMEFILPIFLIVLYMIMGIAGDLYEMMSSVPDGIRMLIPAFLIGGTCTINMMSATTFSREGKMREVYSALPITRKDRLLSKMGIHVLMEIPTVVVCLTVFCIIFHVGPLVGILSGVWCMGVTVLSSFIGLNIDIRNPYRDWEKRVEALKKNFNGMKGMFLTFILGAISIVPWYFLKLDASIVLVIAIVSVAIVTVPFVFLLRKAEEKI